MSEKIRELCLEYTDMTEEEIEAVIKVSYCMETLAALEDADVFIDCPTRDAESAIVVAEAKPVNVESSYKNTVVGQLAYQKNEPAVIRTLLLGVQTKEMKAVTQEDMIVSQSVAPIWHKERVVGVLITEKDKTKQVHQAKQLEMLERSYENLSQSLMYMRDGEGLITEHIEEAIIILDRNGFVRFRNNIADQLYQKIGYKDDIMGMHYDNISLDKMLFSEMRQEDFWENLNIEVREVGLGKLYLSIKKVRLSKESKSIAIMIKDLTKTKEKEKELVLKSVAIKEIHHRVKNNLQMVASLLRLQIRRSDNEQTQQALHESMNRILSIAATHELLSREGVDDLYILDLIKSIRTSIMQSYMNSNLKLQFDITGDNFQISSEKATSIGLIVNELLQNSIQYAFKGRTQGNMGLDVQQGKQHSKIYIWDDGVGFSTKDMRKKSLGMSIVGVLVREKLLGELHIDTDNNGTRVVFDFKN